ncbi:hypothetical protein H0H93_001568 [Arthromyces matolae]|nr:hypothetical protein H0H93_001568 [Arthromyces matolae]
MKVPYPSNLEAVESVNSIIELMRTATASDAGVQTKIWSRFKQWLRFRAVLTGARFGLALPSSAGRPKDSQLTKKQLAAIQKRIEQAVEQHNDNKWVKEGDFESPEDLDGKIIHHYSSHWKITFLLVALSGDDNEESPAQLEHKKEPKPRSQFYVEIPELYFLPKSRRPHRLYIKVPRQNDARNDVKSVNDILELMALVGGSDDLQKSWHTARDHFQKRFGVDLIGSPSAWGPVDQSKAGDDVKATEARKETVWKAVKDYNNSIGDRRGKKRAERPHETAQRAKKRIDHKPQAQALPPAQSHPVAEGTPQHLSQHDSSHGTETNEEANSRGSANTEPLSDSVTAAHAHDEHGRMRSSAGARTYYDPIREG